MRYKFATAWNLKIYVKPGLIQWWVCFISTTDKMPYILQHFILVFTVWLNLIIIAKPKYIHLIWRAQLLSPVCAIYLFYVYLHWNKLYVLRLWINTFSPYPLFLFFPPQIYLKIKKWEKQEYTVSSWWQSIDFGCLPERRGDMRWLGVKINPGTCCLIIILINHWSLWVLIEKQLTINTGWERKYMWPVVLICIVDKSLCFLWPWWRCVYCQLCNEVLDIDNLVSVFYLFLFF